LQSGLEKNTDSSKGEPPPEMRPATKRPINPSGPETEDNDATPGRQEGGKPGDQGRHGSMKGWRAAQSAKKGGEVCHIDFSIIAGDDPVSGPDHLPRYLGISQIAMIFEAFPPEVEKEEEPGGKDEPSYHPSLSPLTFTHAFSFHLLRLGITDARLMGRTRRGGLSLLLINKVKIPK